MTLYHRTSLFSMTENHALMFKQITGFTFCFKRQKTSMVFCGNEISSFFPLSRKTRIEVSGHGLKKKEFEQKAECFTRRLD